MVMRLFLFLAISITVSAFAKDLPANKVISKIAFGSCQKPDKPLVIYDKILKQKPDLFVLLGDNIYAKTIDDKKAKYLLLDANPNFKKFRDKTTLFGIWDDNDYGTSDSGGDYAFRKETKDLFLDFFKIPPDSEIRSREGIYRSQIYGKPGKQVQLILLDNRSFRSRPKISPVPLPLGLYIANDDPKSTILGEEQWKWLEGELKKPADLRVVATSFQFLSTDHHFEHWSNFPHERKRFIELLRSTGANGAVFISGDRHMGMILHEKESVPYELFEATSSGLTEALPEDAPVDVDKHQIGKIYFGPNFGLIKINWSAKTLSLQIRTPKGEIAREQQIKFSQVTLPESSK